MGCDSDTLIAELDALPAAYRWVGSDGGRDCWGLIPNLLEPKVFRQNPSRLPGWCSSTGTNSLSGGIK